MLHLSTLLSRHRIVVCAVLLIFGIITAGHVPSVYYTGAIVAPFIALAIARRAIAVFVIFFTAGTTVPFFQHSSPDPALSGAAGQKVSMAGWVYKNAQKRPGNVKIPLKVETLTLAGKTIDADGKIIVYSNGMENLAYGDRVEMRLTPKPVKEFKNPGAGGYMESLVAKNVFFTAYADSDNIKATGGKRGGNPILRLVNGLRRDYAVFIRKNLGTLEAEIVNSLSIGEKSAIPDERKRDFTMLGIGHLFAISGLHVGVAAVFFYMSVKWLLKRSEYLMVAFVVPRIAAAATIPAVFLYCMLTGMSNSAVRAAIMASAYLIAFIAGRKNDRLNSLAAAAIIILLVTPKALFEASFILSFTAVLGILLALNFRGGDETENNPAREKTLIRKISEAILAIALTTVAATIATLPFVINMFGLLPVLTLPANIIAMPLALLMVPLCFFSVAVFAALGFVPDFLLETLFVLALLLSGIAEILASIKPAVAFPALGKWTFALFYMFVGSVLLVKFGRKTIYAAAFLAVCLTGSVLYDIRPVGGKETEASFFDAGRKNIALFIFQDGKTVLIKGGFSKKARSDFIEKAVVSPVLLRKRIAKTDLLILLSNDRSQLNGAAALIEKNGVENLWINSPKLNNRLWKTIEKRGVTWKKLYRSAPVQNIGENGFVQIKFLQLKEKLGINNSSTPNPVLVKVVCGKTSFLLMESIHNTYKQGMEKLYNEELRSDVVFLPEINVKNRATLLAVIKSARPKIVVCANCGKDLEGSGLEAEIRETETEGMVSVFTDGKRITRTEVFRQNGKTQPD